MPQMHEVDYEIFGDDMQYVEIELDPGEAAVAEAGGMMYMEDGIGMQTLFGDGSERKSGFLGSLMGAGKRLLTGESLFMTIFGNEGHGKKRVAFAAPYPGKIIPFHLSTVGGELIAQKDAFLCAAKGVSIGIALQKKMGAGLFGGEGFIMQKLEGDGWAFCNAGGTIKERDLAPGELLRVDTGCLVALTPSVHYDIEFVGGVKSAIFGGEGLFFATLRGPGKVWLQSLPISRMAGRILAASRGGKGEGLDPRRSGQPPRRRQPVVHGEQSLSALSTTERARRQRRSRCAGTRRATAWPCAAVTRRSWCRRRSSRSRAAAGAARQCTSAGVTATARLR